MLSSNYKKIFLENGLVAIFNNIILDILLVRKDELYDIENMLVDEDTKNKLMDAYIYVTSKKDDIEIISKVKESFENHNSILETLYIIPTSNCNLSCNYCYIYNNKENDMPKTSSMTKELAKDISYKYIDYVKHKKDLVPFIQFYGGEPTLNFDVVKIMSKIFRTHLANETEISFITNGTSPLDSHVDFLKEYNIGVGISLDGPDYINNVNRISLSNSYYDKAMNNFLLLKNEDINYAISLTVTDDVLDNSNSVLQWIENSGAKSVNYNFIQCYKSSDRYAELSNQFLLESLHTLKNISNDRINRKVMYFASNDFIFSDCSAGYGNQVTITPDGFVTICQGDFMNSKKFYSNIKDSDFFRIESVLKNKNSYKIKSPIYNSDCLSCEAIKICGGSCDMKRLNEKKTPVFCEYTKNLLKWCISELSNDN